MTSEPKLSGAPTTRPGPTPPREYRFPSFERRVLQNGITLIVAPIDKLPVVTVLALVDAGAGVEDQGKFGVASLVARLLTEGAGALDGEALAERLERIGASVEAHADWDVSSVSLTALSRDLAEALQLVRDMLCAPTFPEREVERLKAERLADLLQQLAEPRGLADEQFSALVYEQGARYAAPEGGSADSVRDLTRDDVQAFYERQFRPANTTLIFAGDVEINSVQHLVDGLFGNWSGSRSESVRAGIDAAPPGKALRIVPKSDAPQSEIRVGHVGLTRNIPDYFDTMVMNAVLGGLFSSRINLNLREVHGYTYGASSQFEWRRANGPFMIHTAVKSEVTGDAVREILGEIERIRGAEIGEEELTLATSYLDGVFPIRYETTAAIASALATLVIHQLPPDYFDTYRTNVRAVTTRSVLEAARARLHPDNLRVVVVGDDAVISAPVAEVLGITPENMTIDSGARTA